MALGKLLDSLSLSWKFFNKIIKSCTQEFEDWVSYSRGGANSGVFWVPRGWALGSGSMSPRQTLEGESFVPAAAGSLGLSSSRGKIRVWGKHSNVGVHSSCLPACPRPSFPLIPAHPTGPPSHRLLFFFS